MKLFIREIRHSLELVWLLAVSDLKMRDQGTALGFLWTLLNPLIYFLVLYNLFAKWMGNRIPDYPLYLIIGIMQWGFFSSATSASVMCIMRYAAYIKNMNFKKAVLVAASVLSVFIYHTIEILILVLLVAAVKGPGILGWHLFALVPIVALNLFLVLSISFSLATIGVYFLDMSRIWGIITSVGLFLTPIFYSMDIISPDKRLIILANPMTHIISATRNVLVSQRIGDYAGLLYVYTISALLILLGYWFFKKHERVFAERVS